MAKRKPGRPKTRPEPKGLGRVALADRLGVPVKTVDSWLRKGAPVAERHGGRVYFDPAAVEAWRDQQAADECSSLPKAKRLHPSDPRYRERQARAALIGLKGDILAGRMIDAAPAFRIQVDAVAALFGRLQNELLIHGDNEAGLVDAVSNMLSDFDSDNPARWPSPSPTVDEEPDAFASTEFEIESAFAFVPVLSESDPRATVANANAERYESELAKLQSNAVDLGGFLEFVRGDCDYVRSLVRGVPGRIVKRVEPGDDSQFVDAVIQYEANAVRFAYCERHGLPDPEGIGPPSPPTRAQDIDPDAFDDVDGVPCDSEFEDLEGTQDDDERHDESETA